MPLADFQRAFAAAVADPVTWASRLALPNEAAAIGDLSLEPRERERLRRMLQHDGMRANQVLLRATRAMPLWSALPLTCDWLRREMTAVLDGWLAVSCDASVQYAREADRFAGWLPEFLAQAGHAPHPALDALRYERAVAALGRQIESGSSTPTMDLVFSYDPYEIVRGWRAQIRSMGVPAAARLCVTDGHLVLVRLPSQADQGD